MFVQVIQGRVTDAAQVNALAEEWADTIGKSADGWIDSTAGVTEDGTSVVFVRFESEDAAQRNSDRPEQGAWWERMAALYDGEPTFANCTRVQVDEYGDISQAGFVQVMQGHTTDVDKAMALMTDSDIDWASLRPDILGTTWAGSEDGNWSMAIHFTSEAAAREGEQKEMPPEVEASMGELNAIASGEPRFFDLRDPQYLKR